MFHEAEVPRERWRVGAEAERFGVDRDTGAPLMYDGERGVLRVLGSVASSGYAEYREVPGGPVIGLTKGLRSVTLEPGAQLELSGSPFTDVHQIRAEFEEHLAELEPISAQMNVAWLGVGFHPFARQSELPWVPKERYAIMREYLPTRGARGVDMMRRTATVQANFDYSGEEDALRKLQLCLRLSPLVNALFANSPFYEGRLSGKVSERGAVWLEMDPSRSGLIGQLAEAKAPRYLDYVEWALDAGMFFFKRDGAIVQNTGQTFRSFMQSGYQGHRATFDDWALHVNTLFPDARLKRTLEVRCCDSVPLPLTLAIQALFTGILYDDQALSEAMELSHGYSLADLTIAQPELTRVGIRGSIGGRPAQALAEQLLDIAASGLSRRAVLDAVGQSEAQYLAPIVALASRGEVPADRLSHGLEGASEAELRRAVIERAQF